MENGVSRRERKKQQVRCLIVDTAMHLFLAQGFEETTIAEIMANADLGTGTFYNYFQSKEEILNYVFRKEIGAAESSLRELTRSPLEPPQKMKQILLILGNWFEENQQLFQLFTGRYRDQSLAAKKPPHGPLFKDILVNVIQEGQNKGDFKKDVPMEIIAEVFMSLVKSALVSRTQISFQDNLKYKLTLFLEGLNSESYGRKTGNVAGGLKDCRSVI